jgi:hypothetical protein
MGRQEWSKSDIIVSQIIFTGAIPVCEIPKLHCELNSVRLSWVHFNVRIASICENDRGDHGTRMLEVDTP